MRLPIVLLVALGLAPGLSTAAFGQVEMPRSVVASGGGVLSGPNHTMTGTLGQAVIGVVSGPSNIHELGFWYPPASVITDAAEGQTGAPARTWLGQNRPNPFNPVTTLEFSIAQPTHVTIKIYDVQGREVRTVVDEDLEPGPHQRVLDAERLASGMYFYRMTAGAYVETRKLVLLK
jgi:hypothetical protein